MAEEFFRALELLPPPRIGGNVAHLVFDRILCLLHVRDYSTEKQQYACQLCQLECNHASWKEFLSLAFYLLRSVMGQLPGCPDSALNMGVVVRFSPDWVRSGHWLATRSGSAEEPEFTLRINTFIMKTLMAYFLVGMVSKKCFLGIFPKPLDPTPPKTMATEISH